MRTPEPPAKTAPPPARVVPIDPALAGAWKMVRAYSAYTPGRKSYIQLSNAVAYTFRDGRLTQVFDGKATEYDLETDVNVTPRVARWFPAGTRDAATATAAIYEFRDGNLWLCYRRGVDPPARFEAKEDGPPSLREFARVGPAPPPATAGAPPGKAATGPAAGDGTADTVWKADRTADGGTVLSDGTFAVTFPAGLKVEAKGTYASASVKQDTGAKLSGYLSVDRKAVPPAAKGADPRKLLADFVRDQVEKDRNWEFGGKKHYNEVKLVGSDEAALGGFKGVRAVIDRDQALSNVRVEGGLHSVTEDHVYVVGEYFYALRAGGSGAPRVPQLFGDNTGFHRSGPARQFFESARAGK